MSSTTQVQTSIELPQLTVTAPESATTATPNAASASQVQGRRSAAQQSRSATTERIAESEQEVLDASREHDSSAPDGGRDAWLVLLGCSVLDFWFIGWGYCWGVLQAALVTEGLSSPGTLAFVGSLASALDAILAIFNARVIRWLGARKTALLGVVLLSLGEILSGFATKSVGGLFVATGLVQGVGSSLCFLVVSVTPAQYFSKRRGLANGIVFASGGLGGAVISLATNGLITALDPAWTFRVVGLMTMVICLPAACLIKERTPIRRPVMVEWTLFRDLKFIVLFLAGAIATFPILVPPFFLPLFGQSLGLTTGTSTGLLAGFNFASAVGRITSGFVADRIGPLNTLFLSMLVSALSMLALWPVSSSVAPLAVFAVVNGAANGGFFATSPTVAGNVFGSARVSVVLSMMVTGWAGGYLLGPPIAGYILNAYGGAMAGFEAFRPAIYYAGSMALGSAMLIASARMRISTKFLQKI